MTVREYSSDAWGLARAAAAGAGVAISTLGALRDAARVNEVIDAIWGDQHMHPDLLRALEYAGGALIGAEDAAGHLVGCVFGFVGLEDARVHLHSHMAAVLPAWQGRGVGHAMKLAQRAQALDRGLDEIRWTYDPMLARNARFNLVKLGGVAARFLPEFYGDMKDKQNTGDRSDRFEVRWRLTTPRTMRALAGGAPPARPQEAVWLLRATSEDSSRPFATEIALDGTGPALVAVPRDHQALRARDRNAALAWRHAAGQAFETCFAAGLVATSIERDSVYLFEPAAFVGGAETRVGTAAKASRGDA